MFGSLGRAVVRRPWVVIGAWLLVAAAIVALAPQVTSVTTSDQSGFLPDSAESRRAAEVAARAFPDAAAGTAVVVVRRVDHRPLTDADTAALRQRLATAEVAPNRSAALAVVPATPAEVPALRTRTAQSLRGTGLVSGVTGEAAIAVDNASAFSRAEKTVTGVTLGLIVVLLLLIFRSPVAALLPLLAVGVGYGVSGAFVALAAHAFDFRVGQELPTMLTVVLFGIGTDYILFLLFRYRERLRAGDSPREAVVAAVERVGEAICSAAFAVIAAFGALVLAVLSFFTTLGPALAIGVAVMLCAALTLVPAVLAVLGRRVFWPFGARTAAAGRRTAFARLGTLVARYPAWVAGAAVIVLIGLAAGITRFASDYDPVDQLPKGTEAATALADLGAGFPPGVSQPTTVYLTTPEPLPPGEIADLTRRLSTVDGVASPLAPRVAADGRTLAISLVLAAAPSSTAALDLVAGPLRTAARDAAPPGATVLVGGPSMAYADIRAATNRDLSVIFPVAGLLFALILAGLLRAALAPLYLVAMVVASFAATLGAAAWVFPTGLAFSIPIILYLFVTAIGTDYNILVTARLREELRDGRRPREAAALAVEHAGPSVGAAALILAGTFGSLLVSGVPFFAQIGFAVTLGIVLVAFVVSILLVPAVTALAGRAAWWPGKGPKGPTERTVPPTIMDEAVQAGRSAR